SDSDRAHARVRTASDSDGASDSDPKAEDQRPKTEYQDIPGFCYSANIEEIRSHDYILTPGRYVGAEMAEDDEVAFAEKMERLSGELAAQFARGHDLEQQIVRN